MPESHSEAERLAEVQRYDAFAEAQAQALMEIAQAAAETVGSPIALVTFLTEDHQWFKAAVGTQLTGTPRAISFCTHAIEQPEPLIVSDATQDPRFVDNPLVTGETGIRFYAGVPLRTPQGMPLGTLCVLDRQPKALDESQQQQLQQLAERVIDLLEERKRELAATRLPVA